MPSLEIILKKMHDENCRQWPAGGHLGLAPPARTESIVTTD
jgi:hypothetical protein